MLMGYDEHWDGGRPGSIAGQSWFEDALDKRMKALDPEHTIVAIGSYGYDWVKGQQANELSFEEAVLSARDSEAEIAFDPETSNPHFSFIEDDGKRHDVWFLDGVTAYNEIHAADDYQPAGYAVWRLGSEDPSIWSVLGRTYGAPAPERCADREEPGHRHRRRGRVAARGRGAGQRRRAPSKSTDETGEIVDETYTAVPTSYVIERTGTRVEQLALTFDDGPDPDWTPKILDILKEKGVHASFFIIGENAEANPTLVQRVRRRRSRRRQPHLHPSQSRRHPGRACHARDQCHPAAVRGAHRPLDAVVPRALSRRRRADHQPTRSCRSRSRKPWAISRSACMSIPTTGKSRPPTRSSSGVIEQVSDTNPDVQGPCDPAARFRRRSLADGGGAAAAHRCPAREGLTSLCRSRSSPG